MKRAAKCQEYQLSQISTFFPESNKKLSVPKRKKNTDDDDDDTLGTPWWPHGHELMRCLQALGMHGTRFL